MGTEAGEEEEPADSKPEATDTADPAPPPAVDVRSKPQAGEPETEEDAAADEREKVSTEISMSAGDSTPNVLLAGKLLMALTEGGFHHLLAGARANAGVRKGRYMFEVRAVETLSSLDYSSGRGKTRWPQFYVRVGVSVAGVSTLMASEGSVCFDSEGNFFDGKEQYAKVSNKFGKEKVIAILINLDSASSNCNTISMFLNGARVSRPQPLPEAMRGKPLFPTVTYKNVTLQVSFGPVPAFPLPFKCLMPQAAAKEDLDVITVAPAMKDGRYEALFPVALPDSGIFEWVDDFLSKTSDYTELSGRAVHAWMAQSGVNLQAEPGGSGDRPALGTGISVVDTFSLSPVTLRMAPVLKRNYIINEIRSNWLPSERKSILKQFNGVRFRKVAVVLLGEPPAEYKESIQKLILQDKVAQAATKEKSTDKKDEGAMDTSEAGEAGASPAVELTEEEKKAWKRKRLVPDVAEDVLAKDFTSFALPTKEEGFDEIRFLWQPLETCEGILQSWMKDLKKTAKPQLSPSAWFKEELAKWSKAERYWKALLADWKDPNKRKVLLNRKREALVADKGEEEAKAMMDMDPEALDVAEVSDVNDIGSGEPLFANFEFEDWVLLNARFEIFLLLHAFKKDLNDPDRVTFSAGDLPFYYECYFGKAFELKKFSTSKLSDFMELVEGVFTLGPEDMLQSVLSEDTPHEDFLKQTELHRRDRRERLDAGDESAKLSFPRGATRGSAGQASQLPRPVGSPSAPAGAPVPAGRPRPPTYPATAQVPSQKRPLPQPKAAGGRPSSAPSVPSAKRHNRGTAHAVYGAYGNERK